MEQLKADGQVNRGFLSVSGFEALRPAKARELGIPDEGGVVLDVVTAGGPAAANGLRTGDVIVHHRRCRHQHRGDLAVALIEHGAGDTVTVQFYRDGAKQSTEVTLGTPPN